VTALEVVPLDAAVGAEVRGVDALQLANDATLASQLTDALEAHGVLVFRSANLAPEDQVAFCRSLGPVDVSNGNDDVEGIYRVSLDSARNGRSASYLRGTFVWHVDGCTPDGDECPQMATVLSAKAVSETGGETEFASS
jgi:alpha-ketoglutarate-dependent taurine dioxygenase